jgi:hypothetical protein
MQWCKEKKTEAGDCCKGPQLNVIWTPSITGESEAAAGDNGHKALIPVVNMPEMTFLTHQNHHAETAIAALP